MLRIHRQRHRHRHRLHSPFPSLPFPFPPSLGGGFIMSETLGGLLLSLPPAALPIAAPATPAAASAGTPSPRPGATAAKPKLVDDSAAATCPGGHIYGSPGHSPRLMSVPSPGLSRMTRHRHLLWSSAIVLQVGTSSLVRDITLHRPRSHRPCCCLPTAHRNAHLWVPTRNRCHARRVRQTGPLR